MRETGNSIVAWIALILAIIALTLGWVAFNRTGADLENRIQREVQEAASATQNTVEEGTQDVQQGAQRGAESLDAGPDGVDEDDTDTGGGAGTNSTDPNTTNQNTTQ